MNKSKARRKKRSHSTVLVRDGNLRAKIDEPLAPLIKQLWQRRIYTAYSCQDVGDIGHDERQGMAMLVFEGCQAAIRFLNVATRFEPGGLSLYNRMSHQGCRGVRCWQFEMGPMDYSYDWFDDSYVLDGWADYDFRVAVFFPATDIPAVLARVKEVNPTEEQQERPVKSGMFNKIKTNRWKQDHKSDDDGLRVLITRHRPRCRRTEESWDEWWKDLGPSTELYADHIGKNGTPISWEEFRVQYIKEMRASTPRKKINQLAQYYNAGMNIILLCYCEDEKVCHRSLAKRIVLRRAAYLRKKISQTG